MERRQQPRKSLRVQVYFICVSADGRESAQDIGMALDISAGGMMLETTTPINTMEIKIIAATADNQQMEAKGGVIYSMQVGEGRYNTGIFFQGDSEKTASFVEQLIRACDAGG
ncbi:MAG: PilZ domain-containing protein [Thermodesulfobacteriota bacterium]